MILVIPISCVSGAFSFYCVVRFLIFCIFYHGTNHIRSMISIMMMGLNPDPLVSTFFALFLCVLVILLVLLVVWGLAFSYQQESITNVIFAFVVSVAIVVESKGGQLILALKFFTFFPNLRQSFIIIVVV